MTSRCLEVDLSNLSDEDYVRATAETMLQYLERGILEVAVNRTNCTRTVVSTNTQWYRDFCAAYVRPSNVRGTKRKRRPRTYIKRTHTEAALKRMMAGRLDSIYAERLMDYVERFCMDYADGY